MRRKAMDLLLPLMVAKMSSFINQSSMLRVSGALKMGRKWST
jgi:hypothetical protein